MTLFFVLVKFHFRVVFVTIHFIVEVSCIKSFHILSSPLTISWHCNLGKAMSSYT
jgi:hypothetical protein